MTGYSQVYEAVPRLMPTIGAMVFGLVFIIVGIGILQAGLRPSTSDSAASKRPAFTVFGWIFLLFSLLWTTAAGVYGFTRWHGIRDGLDTGKYSVVTGRVENFDMSLERYPSAWFSVAGKDFRFHGGNEMFRFRGPQDTWPLQPEQEVRLSYICQGFGSDCIDPIILRVEVPNNTPLPVQAQDAAAASSAP